MASPVVETRATTSVLRAEELTVTLPSGRTILHPTSMAVQPGELKALMGPSGSGKTTLLRAMAGVGRASGGAVTLDGDPILARLTEVGYVPQSDTVHDQLTARETLTYAATLRNPPDAPIDEIDALVDAVLDDLGLLARADTRVGDMSGGERKRTAFGVELVGRPGVLLLDEPTSGLDPILERRMMTILRHLADDGRGVIVVTHATSSLDLCDGVLVMTPDGRVGYEGAPEGALTHFGIRATVTTESRAAHPRRVAVADIVQPGAAPEGAFGRDAAVIAARYTKTLLRDRKTLAALLGQAPIIAILAAILFPTDVLDTPPADPTQQVLILFLLLTGSVWLGVVSACREIVKERPIVAREHAMGVQSGAYILAKLVVLFALTAVEVLLLVAVLFAFQPLHANATAYFQVTWLCILTAWVSAAMGLVVSAIARSADQAASLVPLLLIPQLLYAGALVPFPQMARAVQALADICYARWAFAGIGRAVKMNGRLDSVRGFTDYGHSFFSLTPPTAALALAVFLLVLGVMAARLLVGRLEADEH